MSRIVLVFVDGLGLGDLRSAHNPLREPELRLLGNFLPAGWSGPQGGGRPAALPEVIRRDPLPAEGFVRATDASLDLPGLPQSATGTTTLLTGINAARAINRHLYGFPTPSLQAIILSGSIFKRLAEAGKRALFANAFRPLFFDLGEQVWQRPMSVTTWANRAGGLPFSTLDDLVEERAVYHDITHESLAARGYDIPHRPPERAGAILAGIARHYDFTLFEFFQTDKAGHLQDEGKALHELRKLEIFLAALLLALDLGETTLVVTSDHGNVEDLSTRTHTWNPVPTLVWGADAPRLAPRLDRLEAFTPAFLEVLGVG
jgi:hypothetical protein